MGPAYPSPDIKHHTHIIYGNKTQILSHTCMWDNHITCRCFLSVLWPNTAHNTLRYTKQKDTENTASSPNAALPCSVPLGTPYWATMQTNVSIPQTCLHVSIAPQYRCHPSRFPLQSLYKERDISRPKATLACLSEFPVKDPPPPSI